VSALGDALGLLETASIAAGVRATDEVLKAAGVVLLEAVPVSPGKFLVVFAGSVAEVEASLNAGKRVAYEHLLDELFLPRVHAQVGPALAGRAAEIPEDSALGIVETTSVAAAIVGADAAAKTANIRLIEIATGRGIGGKGFFTMAGDVSGVDAAASAAKALCDARGAHVRTEILAGPHAVLSERVARGLLRRPAFERFPGDDGE
jgi:bacterial microcompartment shell protein